MFGLFKSKPKTMYNNTDDVANMSNHDIVRLNPDHVSNMILTADSTSKLYPFQKKAIARVLVHKDLLSEQGVKKGAALVEQSVNSFIRNHSEMSPESYAEQLKNNAVKQLETLSPPTTKPVTMKSLQERFDRLKGTSGGRRTRSKRTPHHRPSKSGRRHTHFKRRASKRSATRRTKKHVH